MTGSLPVCTIRGKTKARDYSPCPNVGIAIGAGTDVLVMPDPEPLGRPDDEQWGLAGVVTDSRARPGLTAYVEIKDNAKGTTQSTKAD